MTRFQWRQKPLSAVLSIVMTVPATLAFADADALFVQGQTGTGGPVLNSLRRSLSNTFGLGARQNRFLTVDRAFVFTADIKDASTIRTHWDIADGYYLYRNKFSLRITSPDHLKSGTMVQPTGKAKFDEYFGTMEVYYHAVDILLPLQRNRNGATDLVLEVRYQGCADAGLCYPPVTKTVALRLPPKPAAMIPVPATPISTKTM